MQIFRWNLSVSADQIYFLRVAMNRMFLFLMFFICSASLYSQSSGGGSKNFGLGLSVISPTGITGKYWLDDKKAIEGTLGLGYQGDRWGNYLHGVLLFNLVDLSPNVRFYAGGGLALAHRYYKDKEIFGDLFRKNEHSQWIAGLRVPAGIAYRTDDKSLEFFGELSANLFFYRGTDFDLWLSIGGRYYF